MKPGPRQQVAGTLTVRVAVRSEERAVFGADDATSGVHAFEFGWPRAARATHVQAVAGIAARVAAGAFTALDFAAGIRQESANTTSRDCGKKDEAGGGARSG